VESGILPRKAKSQSKWIIILPQVGACLSALGIVAKKTSLCTPDYRAAGFQDSTETIGAMVITCFFVTRPYA